MMFNAPRLRLVFGFGWAGKRELWSGAQRDAAISQFPEAQISMYGDIIKA